MSGWLQFVWSLTIATMSSGGSCGSSHAYAQLGILQLSLIEGIVLGVIGFIIMLYPLASLKVFIIMIGIWALLTGLFMIYISFSLDKIFSFRNVILIGGILFSLMGLAMLVDPVWMANNLMIILGIVFLIIGIISIYTALWIRTKV